MTRELTVIERLKILKQSLKELKIMCTNKFLSVVERLEALKSGRAIRKASWDKNLKITLQGKYLRYKHNDHRVGDRVAEDILDADCSWVVQDLEITKDDLGKKIEYEDGSKGMIIGYTINRSLDDFEIVFRTDKGDYDSRGVGSFHKIIKIL